MSGIVDLAIAAGGGGGGTLLLKTAIDWMRSRGEAGAKIEEHRDQLTFDLLNAAQTQMTALSAELAQLRPLNARIAHLEEALDHLHALLHADGEAECIAARRRARAFLKRMRPDIGDLRNQAQAATSAANLADRFATGGEG